jgi:hypothetical protein
MLDVEIMDAEINPSVKRILKAKSILGTIWREVRAIVSNNPSVRNLMKLETIHPGVYTVDSGFAHIQECINFIMSNPEENNNYDNLIYIIQQLHSIEIIIREVLQYFKYFIRPEYVQKPDINVATEKYKNMADERTVDELKNLLGDKSILLKDELEIELDDEKMEEILEDPIDYENEDE